MDGQGSAAAREANERLYAMRAALAATGAADTYSHSHELLNTPPPRGELTALAASPTPDLPTLFATLPAHLGWGSETLAAHLRRRGAGGPGSRGAAAVRGGLLAEWGLWAADEQQPPASSAPRHPGPPAPPRLVKVYPDLALALLRTEQAAAGRVWLLLRALDEAGRGMVGEAEARAALTGKGSPLRLCGWRRLRQLLAAGEGVFWARELGGRGAGAQGDRGAGRQEDAAGGFSPAPPRPRSPARLRLFGPARVAAALGVARLVNRPVGLPAAALLGSIGDARAQLYAAFHSGRARLVTSDEVRVTSDERRVASEEKPLHSSFVARHSSLGHPISRATLSALSGACPRSQTAYERRAGVAARDNYALGERVPGGAAAPAGAAEQERAWRQGRALFRLTDHHGRQGAPGATYLAWRLPNTYGPARGHQQRPKGRQKRINRQLTDLFTKGMTGNGRRTIEKRYFAGAAAAFRALEKRPLEGRGAGGRGGGGKRGVTAASFTPAPLLPRAPAPLHWPDGRTPAGAGVWRVVGELDAHTQGCQGAKQASPLRVLASSRPGVESALAG